jgi:hypothetical protein
MLGTAVGSELDPTQDPPYHIFIGPLFFLTPNKLHSARGTTTTNLVWKEPFTNQTLHHINTWLEFCLLDAFIGQTKSKHGQTSTAEETACVKHDAFLLKQSSAHMQNTTHSSSNNLKHRALMIA